MRDPSEESSQTTIERFNQNDDVLKAMLSMPTQINESMVSSRREELFEIFWTELTLEKQKVIQNVQNQEETFIEEYSNVGEGLPEWLLRMEAQDILLREMSKEFNKKSSTA